MKETKKPSETTPNKKKSPKKKVASNDNARKAITTPTSGHITPSKSDLKKCPIIDKRFKFTASLMEALEIQWLAINRLDGWDNGSIVDLKNSITDLKKANYIIKNFNPLEFDPITVGITPSDEYVVIDGYVRLTVLKIMGLKDIPCRIRKIKNKQEAAGLWMSINEKYAENKKNAYLKLKARIIDGDESLRQLVETAERHDFVFAECKGINVISCFSAIEKLQKNPKCGVGIDVINETLSILRKCFNGSRNSTDGVMIKMISMFLIKYQNSQDYLPERLITVLKNKGVDRILSEVKAYRVRMKKTKIQDIGADYLCEVYNSPIFSGEVEIVKKARFPL